MPWTDKPGGSGNNGGGRGPWGQQPPGGGDDGDGQGRGDRRPDLEDLLRSGRDRFRRGSGRGSRQTGGRPPEFKMPSGRVLLLGGLVLLGLYLASGIYQVSPGARGVVTTFGKYSGLTGPGLHWHAPWPIQAVANVNVDKDEQITVGSNSGGISMLTSDLNIVDVTMTVSYKIRSDGATPGDELPNAAKFLFNVENPEPLVESATESALREVVGANEFEPIIARGRSIVNEETQRILQDILDEYESGIEIIRVNFGQANPPNAVKPAQLDVNNAISRAEQDVNEATRYRNSVVPVAEGQARQTVLEAEAYAAQVIAEARGAASRFNDIYGEYARAPEVTRRRMYLETLEDVLAEMNKVVIDDDAGGTLPYLNLNELAREQRNAPRRSNNTSSTPGGNQ